MRLAALLLLAATVSAAELELPLGNLARVGVPVVVVSDSVEEVHCDGWVFPLDGVDGGGLVAPAALPCVLRDADGEQLAVLEEIGRDELLVGVVGDAPADLEDRLGVRVVRGLRLDRLRIDTWQALDLFDRIVVTDPADGGLDAAALWVLAGGDLVVVGREFRNTGLGSLASGADLEEALRRAGPVRPLLIPRPGIVRPDVYDLVPEPAGPSDALVAARWVVAGAALAMLVQLAFGALGLIRPRILVGGLAAVALLAALIGLLRTRADYSPVLSGRIEVEYQAGRFGRDRLYLVHRAVGPGARAEVHDGAVPLFYRAAGKAWWTGAERMCSLEPGTMRALVVDTPRIAARAPELLLETGAAPTAAQIAERPVLALLEGARPARGRWGVFATRGLGPLQGDSVLARLVLVAQR